MAHIDPFPVCILPITNTKAGGYVEVISQAFDEISNYNIKIGSCICDGNLAQKKAFSYTWKKSLRFFKSARWLKEVIFIPCLCHKLNNAYKMTILHNPVIQGIIEEISEAYRGGAYLVARYDCLFFAFSVGWEGAPPG